MDSRLPELVKYAMVPYRLNLEAGDKVLIVADTGTEPAVVQAFMAAAVALDIEAMVATTTPPPFHHAEVSPMVAAAMDEADLVHLITSKGSLHCKACHGKQLNGKPFVASEEISVEMLRAGAATADYERMNELGDRLQAIWRGGTSIHITSEQGTDLRAEVSGRPSWVTAGRVRDHEGLDLYACGFPDGEVGIAPIEETIEGVVVWDTSMHQIGLLGEPIRARVERGRAVELTGGAEADRLRAYLEANGDEGSWMIGETSIGINDKARVTGFVREDKKLAGSIHIALGMNTDTGGTVASRTHVDGVIRSPTLVVDDQTVVREGTIAIGA